jgi:hypothetical protein
MYRLKIFIILVLGFAVFCGSFPVLAQNESATQSYVVQKGDTANSIAKRFYGKSSLGSKLWRANQNLVAHPKRLTPGDVIYIFPESSLALNKAVTVPPAPLEAPTDLYEKANLLKMAFPKYFSFLADTRGLGGSGAYRVRIKKADPTTRVEIDELYEVQMVGEIVGSSDRGATVISDGFSETTIGRTLLSTGDNVIIRFTTDLAKIRDSETYDDSDTYFNTFPVYAVDNVIQEPDITRADYKNNLGNILRYKGLVTIVSRIEGLPPVSEGQSTRVKSRNKLGQDVEPVSYVARITYAEDAIQFKDKILYFYPLDPGPERRLDPPYVEAPDSYVSPGK